MARPAKAHKGIAMEGPIARWYARLTRNDLKRHQHMAAEMAKRIAPGSRVLEVAPGPGYFCIELAKLGDFEITGVDVSRTFVEIARRNAQAAGVRVEVRHGNASALPFADCAFDFAFCQAAFKNFAEPARALEELSRVLRPGGQACVVDLRRDASLAEIDGEVDRMRLGPLNRWLTRQTFRRVLLKSAYTAREVEAMAARTRFASNRIELEGISFRLWLTR
jgi:ubiquinone/menaquinone biosynthesis C-methylase UbiE